MSRLILIQNETQRLENCRQLPKKENIHYQKFLDMQHDDIQHNDTQNNQYKCDNVNNCFVKKTFY